MAKKQSEKTRKETSTPHRKERRFARCCLVLLAIGLVALLWLSLLSFSPYDAPAKASQPPQVNNAAGVVGAHIAHYLRYWLGGGVYLGLLAGTVAIILMLAGGRVREVPWRVLGVVLLITAASSSIHLSDPDSAAKIWTCSAGILGTGVGSFLLLHFSQIGSWFIVVIAFCISLLLTADRLILLLPRFLVHLWRGRGKLGAFRNAFSLPRRRSPAAVPARPTAAPVESGKGAAEGAARPAATAAAALRQVRQPPDARPARPAVPVPSPRGRQAATDAGAARAGYELPSDDLLAEPGHGYAESQATQALEKRAILQQTLDDFNVAAEVVSHMTGPVITMFELSVAPGVKVSQVGRLANDIARSLSVPGVRVVSPLPGRDTVGIEVPNMDKEIVRIKELMNMAPEADKSMFLPLYLGKNAEGNAIVADLASMPHMLIAGTTGSGKSVCINSIIMAILMRRTPEDVRLILIDPKMVEMATFESIPHLLCPIVNDMRRAEDILEWAAAKMDERYELLKEAGVKNITGFNRLSKDELRERFGVQNDEEMSRLQTHLPHYVIIVDELADLIMTSSKEVEGHIIRIAQKARAVGIHLILATQRPSVNVVTGLIKSNMPCRISFRVASRQESRIVLDQNGAEVLLGQGDMLFLQPGTSHLNRAQGTYVDDAEIRHVVKALRKAREPDYEAELTRLTSRPSGEAGGERDELFDKAVDIVLQTQRGSVSLLQRRLSVGYSRASRIIDQMFDAGMLGEYKGSQARECLLTVDDWQAMQASIAADQSGQSAADGEPTTA